jgi:Na+/serine symporter
MIRLDTGGGAIATFVICALVILGAVWFIAEVVNPIICYLSSGDCS